LEIAIALSILGLISGFLLTKTVIMNKITREQTTKNNIATVAVALATFVANNNRLPRPALDNGHETTELNTYVGKIPYYALGISVKNTVDGRGRPLIYIVEAKLTREFDRIYDTSFNGRFFCAGISDPKIVVDKAAISDKDPIAFVLDVKDNPPNISDEIKVTASRNTYWVSRDMLLMQYMKNSPCRRENNVPDSPLQRGNAGAGTAAARDPLDLF
jgi:type II secretory pathway pseudopilin PulG